MKGEKGAYDLKVGNVLTAFVDAFEAALGLHSGLSKELVKHSGTMTIKNFVNAKQARAGAFPVSYRGSDQFARGAAANDNERSVLSEVEGRACFVRMRRVGCRVGESVWGVAA